MNERDEVFRNRLIALMTDLNSGESRDPQLRRVVGTYANKIHRDARSRNWVDLKERADGPTYDSLLRMFQQQSEEARQKGDTATVKALELLAISMIARRQYASDLQPGIKFLDKFIEDCLKQMKPRPVQVPRPLPR